MQQIAEWLEKLGMSEYAHRFAENRLDLSVLPDLTDQDLEKLGVVLGDRRKILRAIANLGSAPPAAASAPAASVQPIAATIAVPTGERRHVTVMFCDLVDSTGIAARLDAEEWRDLVGAYLDAATAAVTEIGGKVAKKLGDGLMALFGYPVAQENDAERAARAALAIQRSLAEQNRKNEGTGKPALTARIAIDTGPVVIDATGEIFGEVLDAVENAALLAPLLDIPLPADRAPALVPEELRRRQLATLTNWVMTGAKVQPVVLALEDVRWADPTTLDVLRGIAERGALASLFVVATTRPEFRPPWGMRSHHGTISLAPLDRAQVRDMVAELSARHALPEDVVEDVAARTGGVPLFVEEVTRLLLERGGQGATVLLMIGHRLMGTSLLEARDIAQGWAHYNWRIALYDPAEHRPLAT